MFITFIINLTQKTIMSQRQNGKKQNTTLERSFKRVLANSGYSDALAEKIWEVYNLQEPNSHKPE